MRLPATVTEPSVTTEVGLNSGVAVLWPAALAARADDRKHPAIARRINSFFRDLTGFKRLSSG